jgi:hypothetical protein
MSSNTINLSHNFMKPLLLSVYDISISKQVADRRTLHISESINWSIPYL